MKNITPEWYQDLTQELYTFLKTYPDISIEQFQKESVRIQKVETLVNRIDHLLIEERISNLEQKECEEDKFSNLIKDVDILKVKVDKIWNHLTKPKS